MRLKTAPQGSALRASRIGVFAALYASTSFVPISMFIGAPSFLALNLIVTPAIAVLLPPIEALFASLFGGVIALYVAPMQAMFGPYTVLLPIAGATFGSLAYHRPKAGTYISALFLVGATSLYLVRNYPFPYFIMPHALAIFLVLASSFGLMTPAKVKIQIHTYISTMCEQGMMMIFAVYLLGLPWFAFPGIMPLMIYERVIGAIGSALVVIGLNRLIPAYFGASHSTSGTKK